MLTQYTILNQPNAHAIYNFKSTKCSRNTQKSNLLSLQHVSALLCHRQEDLSTMFKSYARQQLQNTGGADKSLARPGRKQANVSVRMA